MLDSNMLSVAAAAAAAAAAGVGGTRSHVILRLDALTFVGVTSSWKVAAGLGPTCSHVHVIAMACMFSGGVHGWRKWGSHLAVAQCLHLEAFFQSSCLYATRPLYNFLLKKGNEGDFLSACHICVVSWLQLHGCRAFQTQLHAGLFM